MPHGLFQAQANGFGFRVGGKSTNLSKIGTGLQGTPDMGGPCSKGDFPKNQGYISEGMRREMGNRASGF